MQPGVLHHADCQLPEVRVEPSREPETCGHTRHGQGDPVVQVTVGGVGQLQGSEADVVQGLVVNTEGLVSVLDQLVDGEGGVVGLHHGVRDLD